MKRSYTLSAQAPSFPTDTPGELEGLPRESFRLAGAEMVVFTVQEDDFARIPAARAWLRQQPGAVVSETGTRFYDVEDSRAAPLVRLTNGKLDTAQVVEAAIYDSVPCGGCGLVVTRLRAAPVLRLAPPAAAGLFWVAEASAWVGSAAFVEALRAAGMDGGLATFPVEMEGGAAGALLGLVSTASLGHPAAPYGMTGKRCPECGRHVVTGALPGGTAVYPGQPCFSFYHVFSRPDAAPGWMWSEQEHPGDLWIDGRVRDWLMGEGAEVAGARGSGRNDLEYLAHGWDPDERATAFLDPALQP